MRLPAIVEALGAGAGAGSSNRRAAGLLALAAAASLAVTMAMTAAAPAWQQAFVLIVLSPLAEELIFRAGLQDVLWRRLGSARAAIVLTAVAFALTHVAVRGDAAAAAVVVPALLIGAAYARWQRVRLCVALHAAMNGLWLGWLAWQSLPAR